MRINAHATGNMIFIEGDDVVELEAWIERLNEKNQWVKAEALVEEEGDHCEVSIGFTFDRDYTKDEVKKMLKNCK